MRGYKKQLARKTFTGCYIWSVVKKNNLSNGEGRRESRNLYKTEKKNILKTDEFIREILSNPKIQGQDHS